MKPEIGQCYHCNGIDIEVKVVCTNLEYGDPVEENLRVVMPVNECQNCKATFVGESGMMARDSASLNYLKGRGNVPEEVLRKTFGHLYENKFI